MLTSYKGQYFAIKLESITRWETVKPTQSTRQTSQQQQPWALPACVSLRPVSSCLLSHHPPLLPSSLSPLLLKSSSLSGRVCRYPAVSLNPSGIGCLPGQSPGRVTQQSNKNENKKNNNQAHWSQTKSNFCMTDVFLGKFVLQGSNMIKGTENANYCKALQRKPVSWNKNTVTAPNTKERKETLQELYTAKNIHTYIGAYWCQHVQLLWQILVNSKVLHKKKRFKNRYINKYVTVPIFAQYHVGGTRVYDSLILK